MQNTLLVSVVLSALTAFVYMQVAGRVSARELTGDDRLANSMFAGWWWALAAITAISGVINLAAAFGYTDVQVHVLLTVVLLFALCASLWGLGFYLVYLFTGRRGAIYLLGLFYLGYYAVIMFLVWQAHPTGVNVGRWDASLSYSRPLLQGGSDAWLLLLVAPQVLGGLAYLSLFFRVDDRSQKYRIALIAGSILVWFGSGVLASAIGIEDTDAWAVASRLIALAAAGLVYLAFQPPRWMQRGYGIEPVALVLPARVEARRRHL